MNLISDEHSIVTAIVGASKNYPRVIGITFNEEVESDIDVDHEQKANCIDSNQASCGNPSLYIVVLM